MAPIATVCNNEDNSTSSTVIQTMAPSTSNDTQSNGQHLLTNGSNGLQQQMSKFLLFFFWKDIGT